MLRTLIICATISFIANQSLSAKSGPSPGTANRIECSMVAQDQKPFDPQSLIGLSLDTVRIFFATIGRITEETQGGDVHLHAISSDSLSHGTRPSEVDAIVGKNGTREFTLTFYKLSPDQLRKFSGNDFAGGKMIRFMGELDYPKMLAHVEMNAKAGMFSMACKAK